MAESNASAEGSRIFISYRREDTQQAVGRLTEYLSKHFAPEQVFDDITGIVPGADFVEALQQGLDTCAAMLVVIGPRWLTVSDRQGRRRLDLPRDWVRQEIAESLRRPGVRVFPVLVDGAEMPSEEELPEALQPLVRRQAFPLTVRHWRNDVEQLIDFLRKVPGLAPASAPGPKSPQAEPAAKSAEPPPKVVTTARPAAASSPQARTAHPEESAQAPAPLAGAEKEKQREGARLPPKTSIGQDGVGAAPPARVPWKPLIAISAVVIGLGGWGILAYKAELDRKGSELRAEEAALEAGRKRAADEVAKKQAELEAKREALENQRRQAEAEAARKGDEEKARLAAAAARKVTEEKARLAAEAARKAFRDCAQCPEMVVIPSGEFTMGSPEGEAGRLPTDGPQHKVTIARPFAVGKYEVTFDEWDACVAAGGCAHKPGDQGWGRGRQPVINVSWEDARAYVSWLSKKTGKPYRLLSEAEWEYAARAGTTTRYPWGDAPGTNRANFRDSSSQWSNKQTAPVGSFAANPFGLHDMIGNVWEWVQDCWNFSYEGAPGDGRAWESGDCGLRVERGGSWNYLPEYARAAIRFRIGPGFRDGSVGFRVARTL
jgi:formylglycine-generating enzyme required for sulfatase activity